MALRAVVVGNCCATYSASSFCHSCTAKLVMLSVFQCAAAMSHAASTITPSTRNYISLTSILLSLQLLQWHDSTCRKACTLQSIKCQVSDDLLQQRFMVSTAYLNPLSKVLRFSVTTQPMRHLSRAKILVFDSFLGWRALHW